MVMTEETPARNVRLTPRDTTALEWLSQMYGAPLDVVAQLCGTTVQRAYALAQRWKIAKRVAYERVDAGLMWVYPTRATAAAYLGWDPGYWVPKPSTAAHMRAVAQARFALAGTDTERWISERVLLHQAPKKERGTSQPHIHDGILTLESGRRLAVEVELTAKEPSRMKDVLYDARHEASERGCAGVVYLVRGEGVRNAVEQAAASIARAHKQATLDDLMIRDLDKVIDEGRLT